MIAQTEVKYSDNDNDPYQDCAKIEYVGRLVGCLSQRKGRTLL
jgi:hypothetical protein